MISEPFTELSNKDLFELTRKAKSKKYPLIVSKYTSIQENIIVLEKEFQDGRTALALISRAPLTAKRNHAKHDLELIENFVTKQE